MSTKPTVSASLCPKAGGDTPSCATNVNKEETGPLLSIRHPLWIEKNPRQDIPVMIFTLDRWKLIEQENLALSAASISPSELGRNAKFVFALSAQYNFAYLPGCGEVDKIMQSKPLHVF